MAVDPAQDDRLVEKSFHQPLTWFQRKERKPSGNTAFVLFHLEHPMVAVILRR
jgi:hypothetical protein